MKLLKTIGCHTDQFDLYDQNIYQVEDINDASLEPDGTMFIVCEAFLYHFLLKSSNDLTKIYNQMKENLIKEKNNKNKWCEELIRPYHKRRRKRL